MAKKKKPESAIYSHHADSEYVREVSFNILATGNDQNISHLT